MAGSSTLLLFLQVSKSDQDHSLCAGLDTNLTGCQKKLFSMTFLLEFVTH